MSHPSRPMPPFLRQRPAPMPDPTDNPGGSPVTEETTVKTFLTPEPIVVETRNAAGIVLVDLTGDAPTTTVEVEQLSGGGGAGFLDELVNTFRQSVGQSAARLDSRSAVEDVRIDLQVTEHGTVLIVDTDPARSGWRTSFAVRIIAPAGSGVRAQTQSADVRITGSADRLDVRTASGDVVADSVTRGSFIQTASGDARVTSFGADAEVRTASGNVTVDRCEGSLSVHSTSGDVRVQTANSDVTVRSVSGDVEIRDAIRGQVQATAVSGDIAVGVHAGSLARVELSSISGDTSNDFDLHDSPAGADRRGDVGSATADAEQRFSADHDGVAGSDAGEPAQHGAGGDSGGDVDGDPGPAPGNESARLEILCKTTSGNISLRRAVGV